jgi:hypothetical protein
MQTGSILRPAHDRMDARVRIRIPLSFDASGPPFEVEPTCASACGQHAHDILPTSFTTPPATKFAHAWTFSPLAAAHQR